MQLKTHLFNVVAVRELLLPWALEVLARVRDPLHLHAQLGSGFQEWLQGHQQSGGTARLQNHFVGVHKKR
jgi:hypothetical protein